MGLASSGVSACNLLLTKNANVFAFDKNKKLFDELLNAKILDKKVQKIEKLSAKTLNFINYVIISPGIPCEKIKKLLPKSAQILSEIELAFLFCQNPVLSVTGTNGKTTTVNLLSKMLFQDGKNNFLVGNVGTPFSEKVLLAKKGDSFVCEASSFQLENIQKFKPHIGAFLNIANDHLDRYKNFESYFLAKQKMFQNMTNKDFAVLNFDDEKIKEFAKKVRAKIFWFSFFPLPKNLEGAFFDGKQIVLKLNGKTSFLGLNKTKLFGKHNLSNIMCASLMAKLFGAKLLSIQNAINNFAPLNHRLEFVGEKQGTKFFDDSKATNIHSTLSALDSFDEKILLFLGGSDKKENFFDLFENLPKNVSQIITFGKMGKKIQKIAKKSCFFDVFFAKTFFKAFHLMKTIKKDEKVVLFSPACASFDEFKNFEERGDCFKCLVKDFLNDTNF